VWGYEADFCHGSLRIFAAVLARASLRFGDALAFLDASGFERRPLALGKGNVSFLSSGNRFNGRTSDKSHAILLVAGFILSDLLAVHKEDAPSSALTETVLVCAAALGVLNRQCASSVSPIGSISCSLENDLWQALPHLLSWEFLEFRPCFTWRHRLDHKKRQSPLSY